MSRELGIQILADGLDSQLLSIEQIRNVLLTATSKPDEPIGDLLISAGILSDDQVDSLIQGVEAKTPEGNIPRRSSLRANQSAKPMSETGDNVDYGGDESIVPSFEFGGSPNSTDSNTSTSDGVDAGIFNDAERETDSIFRYEFSPVPRFNGKEKYLTTDNAPQVGGMGMVRRFLDQHTGSEVALKEIKNEVSAGYRRFKTEATALSRLAHPGIIPIHEFGETPDKSPFYTMPFLRGRSLRKSIEEFHEFPKDHEDHELRFQKLLNVFVDICNAVGFAHEKGVVHRDLKPDNVMLGNFGEAVVIDWGLAKLPDEDRGQDITCGQQVEQPTTSGVTVAGKAMGTEGYMSAEQARGDAVDHRTDIYSLGVILKEILQPPAKKQRPDKPAANRVATNGESPTSLVTTSSHRPLGAVCRKAMNPDREQRYESAQELANEIERWLAGEAVSVFRDPWLVWIMRWMRKHRSLCLSVTSVFVAVVIIASVIGWKQHRKFLENEKEFYTTLHDGQAAFAEADWDTASEEFTTAKNIAERELKLPALISEVEQWHLRVTSKIEKRREIADAENKLKEFQKHYDNALASFYRPLSPDSERGEHFEHVIQECDKALQLFRITEGTAATYKSGIPEIPEIGPFKVQETRNEIEDKLRELLFYKADSLVMQTDLDNSNSGDLNLKRAIASVEKTLDFKSTSKAFHGKMANYLKRQGKLSEAESERAKESKTQPADALDSYLLGEDAYNRKEYEDAIEHLSKSIRLEPNRFWTQYLLAICQLKNRQLNECIASLTTCQVLNSKFLGTYLLRGFAYGEVGNFDAALHDFEKAEELDTAKEFRYDILLNRGVVFLRNNKIEESINDFNTAITLRPELPKALINLANALGEKGEESEALRRITKVTGDHPSSFKAHHFRGKLLSKAGDAQAALAEFEQAIACSKNDEDKAASLLEIAKIHLRATLHEEVVAATEFVKTVNGSLRWRGLLLRGIALGELNKRGEAFEVFSSIIDDEKLKNESHQAKQPIPDFEGLDSQQLLAIAYSERGFVQAQEPDVHGAWDDFTQAIALLPDGSQLPEPYWRRRFSLMHSRGGWMFLVSGQSAALAERHFDTALQMPDHNSQAEWDSLSGRGYSRALLGDTDAAIKDAEESLKRVPEGKRRDAQYNAACIYAEALSSIRRSYIQPDPAQEMKLQTRALALIQEFLEFYAGKEKLILQKVVIKDHAMDSIRECEGFRELLEKYGLK